jgi:hypothetical protein
MGWDTTGAEGTHEQLGLLACIPLTTLAERMYPALELSPSENWITGVVAPQYGSIMPFFCVHRVQIHQLRRVI